MSRKKSERRRRSAESENSPPPSFPALPVANPPSSHCSLSDIRLEMDGMVMFFTGIKDEAGLCEIREKCRSFGRELNGNPGLEEKNVKISSRSVRTVENCSSRSFFT